jgi:hypothetical protein
MTRRKTQEEFLADVTSIAPQYNYDKSVYISSLTNVVVHCYEHGDFEITPKSLMVGCGCIKCGRERQKAFHSFAKEEFVEAATLLFGVGRYGYSCTKYVNNHTKVDIFCNTCNEVFTQRPQNHLAGRGCPSCGADKAVLSRLESSRISFLTEAPRLHAEKNYDYSLVDFKNMTTKVVIICPAHDKFKITPHRHMLGGGCPSCAVTGYSVNKPGSFYVLQYEDITKVGITNREPETRCKHISKSAGLNFSVLYSRKFQNGTIPLDIETLILKELRATHKQLEFKFDGSSECFFDVDRASLLNRIEFLIKEQHSSYPASQEA